MAEQTMLNQAQAPTPTGSWAESAWFRSVLVISITLGVFFRLYGLGNKMFSHDEIYTSIYATGRIGGDVYESLWDGRDKTSGEIREFLELGEESRAGLILSRNAFYQPHQAPLFFLLEHYSMKVFGHSPAALRGLAAVFGLLSIPAMFGLGLVLFESRRAGLMAMVLLAVSPFHVLFSQDARPYSLWTLLMLLSSALLFRAVKKESSRIWVLYSLTLILGLYTHQLFLLVAVAQGMCLAGMSLARYAVSYKGYLWACLTAIAAYAPWLYFMLLHWQQAAGQVAVLGMQTTSYRYVQRWLLLTSSPLIDLDFNSNTANLVPYALRGMMMVFLAYCLFFLLRHAGARGKLFIVLIYLVTAGSLISLDLLFGGIRSTIGRYFVPAAVATILAVAFFLSMQLDQTAGKTHSQSKLVVGLLIVAGVASNLNILSADTWWHKELSRIRPEFIRAINRDGTLLIVSGYHPTNLGDVLLLGLEVDVDVHFRLYEDPADIDITGGYQTVYWFPASQNDFQMYNVTDGIETKEILQDILWQIVTKD